MLELERIVRTGPAIPIRCCLTIRLQSQRGERKRLTRSTGKFSMGVPRRMLITSLPATKSEVEMHAHLIDRRHAHQIVEDVRDAATDDQAAVGVAPEVQRA